MKRIFAFLTLGIVLIAFTFAEVYMRNFRQRGSATFEIQTNDLVGAHPTLPIGTPVTVTNLNNNKQIAITIDDHIAGHGNRIIDLSWGAAIELETTVDEIVPVSIEVARIKLSSAQTSFEDALAALDSDFQAMFN
jgi:rare lipoprotein A